MTESPGFADGQKVVVRLAIINDAKPKDHAAPGGSMSVHWSEEDNRILDEIHRERIGEGLHRIEGALAGDVEWDEIIDEIHRSRSHDP